MFKLFKNFSKKDIFYIILCILFIVVQVWLDLKLPDYMSEITVLVQSEDSTLNDILIQGLYMLGCAFGSLISAVIVGYFSSMIAADFSLDLRKQIFRRVEDFGTEEIKKFSTSSLITRTTNDVTQVEMLIAMGLQMLIKAPIMAVWAISKIVNKSIEWSLLTGGCVVVLLFTIGLLMIIVMPRFQIVQKLIDKINGVTRENLTGIRVIRAFNAENYQKKRFEDVNNELTKTQLFNQRCFAILNPVMNIVMQFLTLGIYFIGAHLIAAAGMVQKITLFSNMVVFSSYGMQVIMSFLMLAMIFMMWPRAQVSARRINEIFDQDISIKDGTFLGNDTKEVGTVEFKNVSFKYPDADDYLLKNISFKANKGDVVAFIGSTGSGKSSLINLVPRFYDATDGEVLVDGVNVKDYTQEALHNKIGYVPQKAVMFTGTVAQNVAYGDNGRSKPTLEEIKKAIEVSQGSEFVSKMEGEYDAHIARGGTNVSGGQKQRVAVARALITHPKIILADEPTGALDSKSTDQLLSIFDQIHQSGQTILMVTHSSKAASYASRVLFIKDGQIFHQLYKGDMSNQEMYQAISDTLTMLLSGGQ